MLGKLKAKCDNTEKGCRWQGRWSQLPKHFEKDCEFVTVRCISPQCKEHMLRKSLAAHLDVCAYHQVHCPHCGKSLLRTQLAGHFRSCTDFPVECTCGHAFLRENQDEHQDLCPNKEVLCSFAEYGCNEAIPRAFVDHHNQDALTLHLELVLACLKNSAKTKEEEVIEEKRYSELVLRNTLEENAEIIQNLLAENAKLKAALADSVKSKPVAADEKWVMLDHTKKPAFKSFSDSSILSPAQQDAVRAWFPSGKWERVYVGLRDGFDCFQFHGKCDEIGPTFTVIKCQEDHSIVGGYTSVSWQSNANLQVTDPCAFIFSARAASTSLDKFDIKPEKANRAICHIPTCGPVFGEGLLGKGHDLIISNNANQNARSYLQIGKSFASAVKTRLSFFTVQDIEVFRWVE